MVEIHPGAAAPQAPDIWDLANGNSTKSISFAETDANGFTRHFDIGTSFTGIVNAVPSVTQQTDFITKEAKTYKNGDPMWMMVVPAQTEYTDGTPDDDGVRAFYLRGQALRALQEEMRRLGIKKFEVGTRITQTLVGLKPPTVPGNNPQKLYSISLVPATSNPEADALLAGTLGGQNVVQQQAWVQPVAQAMQPPVQQVVQQAAPAQTVLPAQTVVPQTDPVAALLAQAAAAAAPLQPVVPTILQEHVDAVQGLLNANIDHASAVTAVTQKYAPADTGAFKAALVDATTF